MTLTPFYHYTSEAPAEPDPEPEEYSDDPHEIKWGYNLADVNRLAHWAVGRSRYTGGIYIDKWQEAWSAIAEHLCTTESYPDPSDLIDVGMRAVSNYAAKHRQLWGIESGAGAMSRSRFVSYWRPVRIPFEERIAESDALWRIWGALPERHRRLLKLAAALENDTALIAAALGMSVESAYTPLSEARRAFKAHWYDGDTPPKAHRASHARRSAFTADQVEQMRDLYNDGHPQTDIARRFGTSGSQISKLIRGKQRPAKESS